MPSLFANSAAAILLALLTLLSVSGCSKQQDQQDVEKTAAQPDVSRTIALAKQNLSKLRLNLGAPQETEIEFLGVRPSPVPGIVELKLRVTRDDRTAIRIVNVTPDLKYVLSGIIVPLGRVPRLRVQRENIDLKNAASRGKSDAPVTIVEYADFQCAFCRAAQESLDRALREYEGKVRLVFKHYPLKSHPWAADAALLSECTRRQKAEAFWKLHDFYFENSGGMTRDNILEKTQEVLKGEGIDVVKLNKCYLEQEMGPVLKKSLDEGKSIGVRGTPAFVVNDVFLSGAIPYPILNAIILEELGRGEGSKADTETGSSPAKAG